jgi:hypothetical protein
MRSAMRMRALRLRGLDRASSGEGLITLRFTSFMAGECPQTHSGVSGGQMQADASRRNVFLTSLSSMEW